MREGSFAGFFRSASAGFRASTETEFENNQYMTMVDEEAQHDFERRWQGAAPLRDAFKSVSSVFAPEEPPQKKGFLEGARENGLIRTLTPGFLQSDEDEDFASTCCPNLGLKQRLFACACCFLAGQFLQFLALGASAGILVGHPGRFARCYTIGNIMMISGSFFLSGPKRQCKQLKVKDRATSFAVFISTMVLTLWVVYSTPFWGRALSILVLVILEWCAQVWYILSYIPYGHTMGKKVLRKVGSCCCTF